MVLSVAAVAPSANGYFTVFPCGTSKPLASSMNFTKGVTLANTVITKLGMGGVNLGKVCVYSNVTTNLVIDISRLAHPHRLRRPPLPPTHRRLPEPRRGHRRRAAGALRGPARRHHPRHPRRRTGRPRRRRQNVVLTVAAVAPGATGTSPSTRAGLPDPRRRT